MRAGLIDGRGVTVRPYAPGDRDALLEIWEAQSASLDLAKECPFPDPDDEHQIETLVMVDADGRVVGAGTARIGVELGMILDPRWAGPRDRLYAAMAVFAKGMTAVWGHGFDTVYARVVGKTRWADRLTDKMGFVRENWPVVKFDLSKVFGGR